MYEQVYVKQRVVDRKPLQTNIGNQWKIQVTISPNFSIQCVYGAVLKRMGEVTYRRCIISEQLSHYQFLSHHKSIVIESFFQLICFLYILASSETTCGWRRAGGLMAGNHRWQCSLLSIEISVQYHKPAAVVLFWIHCQGSWGNVIPTLGWQLDHQLLFGDKGHITTMQLTVSLKFLN